MVTLTRCAAKPAREANAPRAAGHPTAPVVGRRTVSRRPCPIEAQIASVHCAASAGDEGQAGERGRKGEEAEGEGCLLYTSPSPRD
eukprot:6893936-Alexandrium_andersonii.AAC.1